MARLRATLFTTLVAASTIGLASCGDGEQAKDEAVVGDARQIASAINVVRNGLVQGDGDAVCGALTDRGKSITVRIAGERGPPLEADSCEAAVEGIASVLTPSQQRSVRGPRDYTAIDVDLDPSDDSGFSDITDTVPERGPPSVEVPCLEGDGNSWFAVRQDDGSWKLGVPFCTGR